MNKLGRVLLTAVIIGTLVVTPVLAAPDIEGIRQQKEEAQNQVKSLQEELSGIISKIDTLEAELIETGEAYLKATDDLEEAELKEKEQYAKMKLRIKHMYEQGVGKDLESILEAKSFAEVLSKAEYIQNIHNSDRKMLGEYQETKKQIVKLKETIEKEMKKLEEQQKEYAAAKANLNNVIEAKKGEVANLEQELQAAIAQAEAERKAKEEAERKAREEAARKKAEQEREQASASGGTSSSGGSSSNSGQKPSNSGSNGGSSSGNSGTNNQNAAAAIVNAAYSQLGVPYVWGGSRPGKGLDCSGLTQYCHRVAGISIPRYSGDQSAQGRSVSNPQPGDIFCQPGHVGIYIGGGKVIHAPEPGDVVKISNVWGNHWFVRYW